MKLFITGAFGLVGSRFVELNHKKFDMVVSDRSHEPPFDLPAKDYISCDVTNARDVAHALKTAIPDVVVHLAAWTDVDGAEKEKGDKEGLAWKVNVLGTTNIARVAKAINARLVTISTGHVFDGAFAPSDEETIVHPLNWYGHTKLEAEKRTTGTMPTACVVRIHYPYRAHFSQKLDLIRGMLAKMRDGTLPPMFTDQKITPTFIDDIAYGLATLLQRNAQGTVHLVGASSLTPYAISKLVAPSRKIKRTTLKEFMDTHPNYAPRPIDDRVTSRRLQSLGITMHAFQHTLSILKLQGLRFLP